MAVVESIESWYRKAENFDAVADQLQEAMEVNARLVENNARLVADKARLVAELQGNARLVDDNARLVAELQAVKKERDKFKKHVAETDEYFAKRPTMTDDECKIFDNCCAVAKDPTFLAVAEKFRQAEHFDAVADELQKAMEDNARLVEDNARLVAELQEVKQEQDKYKAHLEVLNEWDNCCAVAKDPTFLAVAEKFR